MVAGIKDTFAAQLRELKMESRREQQRLLEELRGSMFNNQAAMGPSNSIPPPRMFAQPSRNFGYPAPAGPRPCYYCHNVGHLIGECNIKLAQIEAGKVRMLENGRFQYPDGTAVLFDNNKSIKERVEEWHARNKPEALSAYQGYGGRAPPGIIYMQNLQNRDDSDSEIERLKVQLALAKQKRARRLESQPQQQGDENYEAYLQEQKDLELANLRAELAELDPDFD